MHAANAVLAASNVCIRWRMALTASGPAVVEVAAEEGEDVDVVIAVADAADGDNDNGDADEGFVIVVAAAVMPDAGALPSEIDLAAAHR